MWGNHELFSAFGSGRAASAAAAACAADIRIHRLIWSCTARRGGGCCRGERDGQELARGGADADHDGRQSKFIRRVKMRHPPPIKKPQNIAGQRFGA